MGKWCLQASSGKWCLQASLFIFYRIFVKLAGGNQDSYKMSNEFELIESVTSELRALVGELNFQ